MQMCCLGLLYQDRLSDYLGGGGCKTCLGLLVCCIDAWGLQQAVEQLCLSRALIESVVSPEHTAVLNV
jgi:hypothetical protein